MIALDQESEANPTLSDRALFLVLIALGLVGLFIGWRAFWFMTDDAYIAFRYVENSIRGFGYVWNAPPFLPVEGYTSFLWVVLLDGIWRLTGLEPPLVVNWISLFFTGLTLVVSAEMAFRMVRPIKAQWARLGLVALLVAYLLLNRSFLAWSSSGLETAMFDFFLILWVFLMNLGRRDPLVLLAISAATALLSLTRPDGLLFSAVTLGTFLLDQILDRRARRARRSWTSFLFICSPFAVVALHLLWRHSFYGEWLPNTYYAKVYRAWPESGLVYLLSFLLEFCLWPILVFVRLAIGARVKRVGWSAVRLELRNKLFLYGSVSAVLLHFLYYTFIVGGDHFEYRPYNHLLPLIFLALIWALKELRLRPASMVLAAGLCAVVSLPVPVTHWLLTKDLNTRVQTAVMRVPISPAWPRYLRWYARTFDRSQNWLISRLVCCRHQEHKIFSQHMFRMLPSREKGERLARSQFPTYTTPCVGIAGWVMPQVYVIDSLGLNDYVIARAPVSKGQFRGMAHNRVAPSGYVEEFRPNVLCNGFTASVTRRDPPLTADDIRRIETRWRAWTREIASGGR